MVDLLKHNSEVEYSQSDVLIINSEWINRIKDLAKNNEFNKYRTCIHFSDTDNVHEMLIAATSNTYIRPHKHRFNGESLQFIEGEATAIIFKDNGTIKKEFKVGGPSSNLPFYYSMAKAVYHMLIIHSDFLIFKETTRGPFIRDDTLFPNWAPDGKYKKEVTSFLTNLKQKLIH
jgi:cupin fold WbuC family metalloprotein